MAVRSVYWALASKVVAMNDRAKTVRMCRIMALGSVVLNTQVRNAEKIGCRKARQTSKARSYNDKKSESVIPSEERSEESTYLLFARGV